MKQVSTFLGLVAVLLLVACKPNISKVDAAISGYCTGVFPFAEIAIQRRYLAYQSGTFAAVVRAIDHKFPALEDWSEDNRKTFFLELGRAENHGGAIQRGDIVQEDITALNNCISWASQL